MISLNSGVKPSICSLKPKSFIIPESTGFKTVILLLVCKKSRRNLAFSRFILELKILKLFFPSALNSLNFLNKK
jgi:hypothetical protein